MISKTAKKQIKVWLKKYPKDEKKSAVMAALRIVQQENDGFLTKELITGVADYLSMPTIAVQEIATFYENYNHKAVGKHHIRFCHNISCLLNGGDDLIAYLEEKLAISAGGVTKDGRFSFKKVECLGACVGAPMMQIGDTYYENLTIEKIDDILKNL